MRPLYSDSITTNTKDEQQKSFRLACHKEKIAVKAEAKQLQYNFSQNNHWTAFCKAPVSKSIKNHIESGLLEQKTWTESRNRTNTPSRRAGTGRFISSAHNSTTATDCPSAASWQEKKKWGVFARIFAEKDLYLENKHISCHTLLCKVLIFENRLSLFPEGLILSDVVLTSSGWVWTRKWKILALACYSLHWKRLNFYLLAVN